MGARRVLSLFSGCGGMDLGFEGDFDVLAASINQNIHPDWGEKLASGWLRLKPTGFRTVFANDIEPSARVAWELFFGGRDHNPGQFHLKSVVDLVKAAKSGNPNVFPQDIDVVTGGFPCQDFSLAGKRRGFLSHKSHRGGLLTQGDAPTLENRGKLYMWMREVVEITKPKIFIAENVKGLVSLADTKSIIENDFRKIGGNGYLVVNARVLHAAEYGVPQSRERVLFIGFLRSALKPSALRALQQPFIKPDFDPYPRPTHFLPGRTPADKQIIPAVTAGQVLKGLPEPNRAGHDLAQAACSGARWMGFHCQGQKEVAPDALGPTIRAEHHGNIEFRRLSQAHGGKLLKELRRGLRERRLTVRECARIQTFPDNYQFVARSGQNNGKFLLSATNGYRLIGNAVPPLLAYHVARRLQSLWPLLFRGSR